MRKYRIIFICFGVYCGLTLFLFVQSQLSASEDSHLSQVLKHEKIVDKDKRATLRAFYTAPPVIPHVVESQKSKDCLTCHLDVTRLDDGRVAMQTPHPQLSSCMQCHVPSQPGGNVDVPSDWQGLEEPKRGDRWVTMAPPTVPHRIALRENCLSCHGPQNPDMALRTPHPERTSCLQCHVPNYNNEFEIK